MSIPYFLPLVIVIFCNIGYHTFSKSLPSNINPFIGLAATYGVAFVGSLFLFLLTKDTLYFNQKVNINKYNLLLGIVIIGVEGGYMLMYRAGWEISKASVIANIVVAILLLVMGAIVFHESVDLKKVVGILFCLLGIAWIK
ncbi:MAG: EamA family transporter [Absicoccus sp.]|uniref:EamA family transporter n=1 Tax=Absicoccus intestinalis TaxID=2926319 RepID=A0ABU4WM07_9FIRM|nr:MULTISPECIES: EamA family transporter [unclassified Absicoccus]MDX8417601.1 EamA family transporter [Absicoccus sp. CLA-KB-P134]MDY3036621.1 EamA family transporter [Absicoccus sp.]